METAQPIILPDDARAQFGTVRNTSKAAALITLGFRVLGIEKLRKRNDGRPPDTQFNIASGSDSWKFQKSANATPVPFHRRAILSGINSGDASVEIDDLIDQIEDKELATKIRNKLPLSHAEYIVEGIEHYRDCIRRIRDAKTTIQTRTRSGGHAKIPHGRPDLARRWNADNF